MNVFPSPYMKTTFLLLQTTAGERSLPYANRWGIAKLANARSTAQDFGGLSRLIL